MTAITDRVESAPRGEAPRHPLDPLTGAELAAAAGIIQGAPQFHDRMIFVTLTLHEPDKATVLGFSPGDPIDREAFAIVLDRRDGSTHEVVTSITAATIRSWRTVASVQPPVTAEEYEACQRLVRADPRFQEALRRRGVTDPDLVTVEGWTLGGFEQPEEAGRRLVWSLCWARNTPDDNPYAHPIEGVIAIVDLNAMEIVRFEDHGSARVPKESGNFTPEAIGEQRTDLKPLEIVQREGPSFAIDGWELSWQKWRFRIGFTPREGLVFHTVTYEDQGRRRPVIYRASCAELVIPYGDPSPSGYRRNAFDIGEYGIGPYTNSLELGCDCLGEIRYLSVDLADNHGEPYTIRNAICIHEEDFGILWKHTDAATGHVEVRRNRRLVVSSIVTVDNYDYAFYWYFYQDGTLEMEAKLTGIVVTSALEPDQPAIYGRKVTPELMAPNHQHFFTIRLDMMVDGTKNTVQEVHTESPPIGPENPYGGAFVTRATPFRRESEAQQTVDPLRGRYWRIVNPSVRNRLGDPVGYKLVPGDNILPFIRPESPIWQRTRFLTRHLWVTPYERSERYPGGDYPNQATLEAGLPAWTRADRPIENTDVVVWYTFGNHHIVRPEEWPVMPVVRIGFALKPDGFFDRNPALDVPPPEHCHNGHH